MVDPKRTSRECKSQPILGFRLDDEAHWVAQLACGHVQHVRHHPPFMDRSWVTSAAGRAAHLGTTLDCKKCFLGAPKDE